MVRLEEGQKVKLVDTHPGHVGHEAGDTGLIHKDKDDGSYSSKWDYLLKMDNGDYINVYSSYIEPID